MTITRWRVTRLADQFLFERSNKTTVFAVSMEAAFYLLNLDGWGWSLGTVRLVDIPMGLYPHFPEDAKPEPAGKEVT